MYNQETGSQKTDPAFTEFRSFPSKQCKQTMKQNRFLIRSRIKPKCPKEVCGPADGALPTGPVPPAITSLPLSTRFLETLPTTPSHAEMSLSCRGLTCAIHLHTACSSCGWLSPPRSVRLGLSNGSGREAAGPCLHCQPLGSFQLPPCILLERVGSRQIAYT